MRLLGSGSKGRSNNPKFGAGTGGTAPPVVNMLDPSQSGNADVVQQRNAGATTGVMQKRQLSKNKSVGLRVIGRLPKGGKPRK